LFIGRFGARQFNTPDNRTLFEDSSRFHAVRRYAGMKVCSCSCSCSGRCGRCWLGTFIRITLTRMNTRAGGMSVIVIKTDSSDNW
jgi:hypothetical protein